ncbi:MAG: iron chaperone [Flavipsychrobacter sp.]
MNITLKYKTVDEYFANAPAHTLHLLKELRETIKQAAPKAEEVISYNMPAIKQGKVLVYYAAYNGHIGFYPTASPMIVFKDQLTKYKTSKGAIQFPLDAPIPKQLVKDIVKFRLANVQEKELLKKK